jgi:hypothetical protein
MLNVQTLLNPRTHSLPANDDTIRTMPHHSLGHLVAYSTPSTCAEHDSTAEEILLECLEGGHDWFDYCFGGHVWEWCCWWRMWDVGCGMSRKVGGGWEGTRGPVTWLIPVNRGNVV